MALQPMVALFGLVAPFAGGMILLYGPRRMLSCSALLLMVNARDLEARFCLPPGQWGG